MRRAVSAQKKWLLASIGPLGLGFLGAVAVGRAARTVGYHGCEFAKRDLKLS
jgi:hypothetical protein